MAKSLNELGDDLKAMIIALESDSRDNIGFRPEKYNNLKLTMDVVADMYPQVRIAIGMSEAHYDINTGERISGSLGQEERYVHRWLNKKEILQELRYCWDARVRHRGKITDIE